jgi:hypothetical protein
MLMSTNPGLPFDAPLVFLSATGYEGGLSGRTRRLAEVLAERGRSVYFVELPTPRNALAAKGRVGCSSPADKRQVHVVRLCPLPWKIRSKWPFVVRCWLSHALNILNRSISRLDQAVVISSTPWWSDLVRVLSCRLRCYDYIDHISVQAGPQRLDFYQQWNHDLLRESDLVTAVSEPLQDWLRGHFDPQRIYLVPNGVFSWWIDTEVTPLARRRLTPHPERCIAGFTGSLFEWLDQDLLVAAAKALPQVEFVLIGPQRRDVKVDRLQALENVHIHRPVPYEQVPRYIQAMDVCLIPRKKEEISEAADSLKVYEYCALGKPVVSTIHFRSGASNVPIVVAADATDFVSAIGSAVAGESSQKQAVRKAFARQHTWDVRADAFISAMEDAYARLVS